MVANPADSINQLYAEALRLADAARGYFDGPGQAARAALGAGERTAMATESLAITARLIAIVSWALLNQAVGAGDIGQAAARRPDRRLDARTNAGALPETLPAAARSIAVASRDLFARALAADAALPA